MNKKLLTEADIPNASETPPAPIKNTRSPWLIAVGALVGIGLSMLTTFIVVTALYHDEWVPTEAEVIATRVESSRQGTLTWSLKADFFYQVSGTRYEKSNFELLHRTLRDDTLAQQSEWPPGKKFTVFVNSDNSNSISLSPDGGREAIAVAAAVLTPALLAAIGFPSLLLARRMKRRSTSRSGGSD